MAGTMGWLVGPLALVLAAGVASAANATKDGKSWELKAGEEVSGPAVINGARDKDSLTLRRGTTVKFLGADKDDKGNLVAESYYLKVGGLDANVGFHTRLATPAFWAFPEKAGARATFYAESFESKACYARTMKGSGMLRLVSDSQVYGETETELLADQGVTVQRGVNAKGEFNGSINFTTDPHNEWQGGAVRVLYPLRTGLLIDLYIPKATSGKVEPAPKARGITNVVNMVTSWKDGKVRIVTARGNQSIKDGEIGPGVEAQIDDETGDIKVGVTRAAGFAPLAAAVSLTSEFESLATSPITNPNFH
jgi:hypothetical protein